MIYDITLKLSYRYDSPVIGGRHLVCIRPMEDGRDQRVIASLLEVEPRPDEEVNWQDFFRNNMMEFTLHSPHEAVNVLLRARIERFSARSLPSTGMPIRDLPAVLEQSRDLGPNAPLHFLSASFRVPLDAAMTRFAQALITPDMAVQDAVLAVGSALYQHMRFDPKATTVDTPAGDAFRKRHGVCQDFSHIMIGCLRGVGIPAAYVSGFLRTEPPPGQARLEGADAMHAWVRAWCGPDLGWIEFDPTNDVLAGEDHVVVARGRDYSDVAPIKGMMRGSGGQKSHQAVDMVPVVG
jgi:transglutaminase-like putative cysteine protease